MTKRKSFEDFCQRIGEYVDRDNPNLLQGFRDFFEIYWDVEKEWLKLRKPRIELQSLIEEVMGSVNKKKVLKSPGDFIQGCHEKAWAAYLVNDYAEAQRIGDGLIDGMLAEERLRDIYYSGLIIEGFDLVVLMMNCGSDSPGRLLEGRLDDFILRGDRYDYPEYRYRLQSLTDANSPFLAGDADDPGLFAPSTYNFLSERARANSAGHFPCLECLNYLERASLFAPRRREWLELPRPEFEVAAGEVPRDVKSEIQIGFKTTMQEVLDWWLNGNKYLERERQLAASPIAKCTFEVGLGRWFLLPHNHNMESAAAWLVTAKHTLANTANYVAWSEIYEGCAQYMKARGNGPAEVEAWKQVRRFRGAAGNALKANEADARIKARFKRPVAPDKTPGGSAEEILLDFLLEELPIQNTGKRPR